jgi:hypothetical protein
MGALILVAEHNGPTIMARIGVMKVLNRHVQRTFNPNRIHPHWGRTRGFVVLAVEASIMIV